MLINTVNPVQNAAAASGGASITSYATVKALVAAEAGGADGDLAQVTDVERIYQHNGTNWKPDPATGIYLPGNKIGVTDVYGTSDTDGSGNPRIAVTSSAPTTTFKNHYGMTTWARGVGFEMPELGIKRPVSVMFRVNLESMDTNDNGGFFACMCPDGDENSGIQLGMYRASGLTYTGAFYAYVDGSRSSDTTTSFLNSATFASPEEVRISIVFIPKSASKLDIVGRVAFWNTASNQMEEMSLGTLPSTYRFAELWWDESTFVPNIVAARYGGDDQDTRITLIGYEAHAYNERGLIDA